MFNVIVKQLCNNLKRLIFNIFPSNSKHTSIVDHFICYSLPLSFQPLLVVGHLDTAVGHLTNTQDLEHQDSKRPNVAPEYQYLLPDLSFIKEKSQLIQQVSHAGELPVEESLRSGPLYRQLLVGDTHPWAWGQGQTKICHLARSLSVRFLANIFWTECLHSNSTQNVGKTITMKTTTSKRIRFYPATCSYLCSVEPVKKDVPENGRINILSNFVVGQDFS